VRFARHGDRRRARPVLSGEDEARIPRDVRETDRVEELEVDSLGG
jgi:hypothetical protein